MMSEVSSLLLILAYVVLIPVPTATATSSAAAAAAARDSNPHAITTVTALFITTSCTTADCLQPAAGAASAHWTAR